MEIELIIFDFDGVLVDSEYIAAQILAQQFTKYGVDISLPTTLNRYVGISYSRLHQWVSDEIGSHSATDFLKETENLTIDAHQQKLRATDHIKPTLKKIQQQTCIATNSPAEILQHKINITKMDDFFSQEKIFHGSMVKNPKPAPDLFLHAASAHKIQANKCLVIEDSVIGVHAAKSANMTVLGYTGASHCLNNQVHEADLQKAGAHHIFNDMRELQSIIEKLENE
ncbi:MAG: hypothetical protein COB24_13690 [Hyphomicrobiales bacterium]|nr:MAG: hypothetical protein COB24_13690 [Hyphomicrobiales bacterium]